MQIAASNACYMFHRSIDSLLKAQYHQKKTEEKGPKLTEINN